MISNQLFKIQRLTPILVVCLFLMATPIFAQQPNITGTVIDETGMPLPGASVVLKGTTKGTVTDIDGNYSLDITGETNPILVISFISYTTQEIPVDGQNTVDVKMAPDTQSLQDVVIVGYGRKTRATLTGSISEIDGDALKKSPQPNLSNSFAGRVPGIIANNRGGEPGYDDSSISIRGLATTGNNDVLVVVDGVPGQVGGLSRLSPEDIESVTVLKDASAAIYGSRAANGVILITTKRGRKNTKPQISLKVSGGFSSPTRLPDMADAPTYAAIRNEIGYYNNPDGGMNQLYTDAEITKFGDGSDPLNYPNTNWPDQVLKNSALQTQQDLTVQGGSENVSYFFSLGATSQDGLYKMGATKYNQYNVRSNIDVDVTDRLTVGLSIAGRKEDRQFPIAGAGYIFRSIYRAYPTIPAYYPNGLPSTGIELANPALLANAIGGTIKNPTYVFNGILRASYDLPFVKGLSIDGFYSSDVSSNFSKNFSRPYTLYNYNNQNDSYDPTVTGGGPDQQPTLSESQDNVTKQVANIKLNYKYSFGDHNVDAFVGYEQSEDNRDSFGATRDHFASAQTPELSQGGAASSDYDNFGNSYNFTRQSYLTRVAYNFQEKYLAEFQMRIDGSSIFPKGKRFGYFPSISAGYNIAKEEWFASAVPFFDELKIRASYGQLGNDNVGQFQYFDNYAFNNRYVVGNDVVTGIDLIKLANPNITWEVAKKTDIGINAKFLRNFNTEITYFKQDRSDILINRNASIPGVTGIVNPYDSDPLVPAENIGKVTSNGFEFTLGYNHPGDFTFGISGNFTYAKNEIKFIDEAAGLLDYQQQTGRSLNTYLLYHTLGIFRTQEELDNTPHVPGAMLGDLIYEDYNEDGEINADDRFRTKYGNIPRITYGLTLNAGYINFDFSAVISGQAQVSQYVLPESGTVGNFYSSWADNRYSPTNTDGSFPRVSERSSSAISGGLYQNDFWLNNSAFARLKSIEVGYTLPSKFLESASIASVRIYANAFNLLTVTDVEDYDPEGSSESGQFYPQQKILNLGVNVQF